MPKKTNKRKKILVHLQSEDHKVLDFTAQKIVGIVKRTGCIVRGPIPLPTEIIFEKRGGDDFEVRRHKRLIDIIDPKMRTINALKEIDLPLSVDIEIKL